MMVDKVVAIRMHILPDGKKMVAFIKGDGTGRVLIINPDGSVYYSPNSKPGSRRAFREIRIF